jgi:hypothetical protein
MAAKKPNRRRRLSEAQGHRCCYCGIRLIDVPWQHNSVTLEHVIPKAAGAWNDDINLVVACRLCNEGRGTMLAASYFDLVLKHGRNEANRLGRRWRKRIVNRDPLSLRERAVSQHLRGPMYRTLAAEYLKRKARPKTVAAKTSAD